MAILKSNEGIIINATNSVSTNFGCRIYESTRLWNANTSGISLIQFTQNGATTTTQAVSVVFKFVAIRTSGTKNELPAFFCNSLLYLNTNGVISYSGTKDTIASGGNLILVPDIYSGGSSFFIGANNNQSTGVIGSVKATICTSAWNNLTVTLLSN
jgi:hypothetical protein